MYISGSLSFGIKDTLMMNFVSMFYIFSGSSKKCGMNFKMMSFLFELSSRVLLGIFVISKDVFAFYFIKEVIKNI